LKKDVGIFKSSEDRDGADVVMIVAGEASGDLHGSNLVKAMKNRDPDLRFTGIGGENMAEAGVNLLFSSSEMAVVGVTEVFSKLQPILRARRQLKSILKQGLVNLLILIDYPDFNLNLAKTAKRYRIPVLYYISPQVWAWRRGRVKKIRRRVERMAVILPFEEAFYKGYDMSVDYVGHPLLDAWETSERSRASEEVGEASCGKPLIGILPGSRREEVHQLLPVMVEALGILKARYPRLEAVLPLAPTIDRNMVEDMIRGASVKIRARKGDIYRLLSPCQMALVASGTAALETAIAGVPMVILYKVSPLSYWIGRMVIQVPYISLVNLVAQQRIVPELIQNDVEPHYIAELVVSMLEDEHVVTTMKEGLRRVRKSLGKGGASRQTAHIALSMMNKEQMKGPYRGENHSGR